MDSEKKECVEKCNEDGNKYEYKTFCYDKYPSNTYPIENNFLCLDKKPEGYYLYNNSEYKSCFETCKTCDKARTQENHNCQECKIAIYPYEVLKGDYKNCYIECPDNFTSQKMLI